MHKILSVIKQKRKRNYRRKRSTKKYNFKRINIINYYYFKMFIIFILICCFTMINIYKKNNNYNKYNNYITYNNYNKYKNYDNRFHNYNINKRKLSSYLSCFITMAKLENKYIREVVEHYKQLGLDKFFIADDNSLNGEKISDVLQDYIDEGFVEIFDIREQNYTQGSFFEYSFDKYKSKCKWLLYFDVDEYLEFVDKNVTINDYLSQERFNKCEVIKINWVMYKNESALYYENKSLKERFPTPTYIMEDVRTVKSIVRNDSSRNPWLRYTSPHEPPRGLYTCNSLGEDCPYNGGVIYPPVLSYCYIKHYHYKSAEEWVSRIKKGLPNGEKHNVEDRVRSYFERNNYSEIKVKYFEKMFNRTFDWLHK